jgi:hypothetical protein
MVIVERDCRRKRDRKRSTSEEEYVAFYATRPSLKVSLKVAERPSAPLSQWYMLLHSTQGKPKVAGTHAHGHVILLCHSAGTIASVYAVESLFSGILIGKYVC